MLQTTAVRKNAFMAPRLASLAAGLSCLAAVVVAAPAFAQTVRSVEPYHVVVTTDNLPMKAGPGTVHYSVLLLRAGQTLRVDGETTDGAQFLRVEYLPGMMAFVKADEATVEGNGSAVRLNADSRLRAANMSGGERGHWWYLLPEEKPLAANTRLTVKESLRTPDSRTYGYLVNAPADARGFIPAASTRRATEAEVQKYKEALLAAAGTPSKPQPAPPPATPASAQPAAEQAGQEVATVSPEPAAATPVVAAPAAEEPGLAVAVPVEPVPAPATPAAAEKPQAPLERQIATLESLGSLYEQAQAQPIREAELTEVIAEFQRAIDGQGQSEEEQRIAAFLRSRMQVLKVRQELQQSLREAEELAGKTSSTTEGFSQQISTLERERAYTVVGRLVPSSVYDGTRLPRMYRVQSVDEGFSRTLAYLTPSEALDLQAKLGRVVGILGDAQLDPALRVNIVRARRVDVLSATTASAPTEGR